MATEIYLGNPPENIANWIKENYKPGPEPEPELAIDYLCFTAEEPNSTIQMENWKQSTNCTPIVVHLETSPTGEEGSWTDFSVGSYISESEEKYNGTEIILANVGDKVYFRAK